MNKNASIQKIIDISLHPNADSLEIASVLGWKCIVRKGEFKKDDYVVFVSIDSLVPDADWSKFLNGHNKIRTIKLRGEISQGLILPVSILPDSITLEEGLDVSEPLGILHYEKSIHSLLSGGAKGNFPSHLVSKTDEVLIQNYPKLLNEIAGLPTVITSKYDGTSATYIWNDGTFMVCSRNTEKKLDSDNVYTMIANKYNLASRMEKLNRNLAIQGEIIGPGIQGNKVGLDEVDIRVFQIFDLDKRQFLPLEEMITTCTNLSTLLIAEILEIKEKFDYTLEELIEKAKGSYTETGDKYPREGIVVRPLMPTYSPTINRNLSFKVINVEYALKYKE